MTIFVILEYFYYILVYINIIYKEGVSIFSNVSFYNTRKQSNIKIWVYSLKRNGLSILFCLFCIGLVMFSSSNLKAAKDGLILWATAVVPSLFPFFVSTELLNNTSIVSYLGKLLNPIMRPLFNVPGEGAFAFLMGLISGYPVGAKIVSNFVENSICTKEEAERMLSFTNNSGPLFIIGTIGISLFGSTTIGVLLFITHILACISVGITSKFMSKKTLVNSYKSNFNQSSNKYVAFSSLGEILGKSITNSISTILMIGGFVVIFSVIISILNESYILSGLANILSPFTSLIGIPQELLKSFLAGIIELTNGVSLVANTSLKTISTNIIICAFLLGFGGISILLQVFSIVSKNKLSIKPYILGKLLQGVFAAFYTFIALEFIPFLHFNL
ncbi:MAG: sporulation integral membrane protein YlbJ [Clostridia bacterium]